MADHDKMSAEALEELLRQDFHAEDGGALDMSEMLRAAQTLAQRQKGPDEADADRSWRSFVEKYRPFASSGRRRRLTQAARAAAVFAIVVLLINTTAAAMGYSLWGMLARWTDDDLSLQPEQIVPVQPEDIALPDEKQDYDDLQQALEAYGFSQRVLPRWLPEGFEQISVEVHDENFPYILMFSSVYQRGEEYLSIGCDVHLGGQNASVQWQKDEGDPVAYEAGGRLHVMTTNSGLYYAVWADSPLECFICGSVSQEELERMIDSLYQMQEE